MCDWTAIKLLKNATNVKQTLLPILKVYKHYEIMTLKITLKMCFFSMTKAFSAWFSVSKFHSEDGCKLFQPKASLGQLCTLYKFSRLPLSKLLSATEFVFTGHVCGSQKPFLDLSAPEHFMSMMRIPDTQPWQITQCNWTAADGDFNNIFIGIFWKRWRNKKQKYTSVQSMSIFYGSSIHTGIWWYVKISLL